MGHNANYAHNMLLNDSDSDDYFEISVLLALEEERLEREGASTSHRGSVLGHRIIQCDHEQGRHEQGRQRLFQDYFAESLVYPLNIFRRRFRISRSLFLHIKSNLEEKDEYFVQKRNAAGVLGLSSLQKMTAALRMLAYGVATDFTDEYVRIGESIAVESLKKFVEAIVDIYSKEYLRSPNSNDITRLLRVGESRGFPAQGLAPSVNYSINGHDYTMRYYLTDGIYPSWSTFVKTIRAPQGKKNSLFATTQESTRKDVECAFGVLQTRFAIVRGPARLWRKEALDYIMKACIILHNMIIENERDANGAEDFDCEQVPESIPTTVSHEPTEEFSQFTTFIVAHEKLEIEKLILNSNWISLSTCGNDMARCRII
ncbi:uncharacterized protein LOC126703730 [Quercus robur]|uniref:uncharacterized protein LOC126703730 n=1 Tax=Quercus robur TaxID=38942 RepID=UPI00216265EA|nr:uncharacterized protein LOC126703730 [Quercus robur]